MKGKVFCNETRILEHTQWIKCKVKNMEMIGKRIGKCKARELGKCKAR